MNRTAVYFLLTIYMFFFILWQFRVKGSFKNYIDKILAFFYHLPPCVDIFYDINIDKKWIFLDHLPTLSCKSSLWTTPKAMESSDADTILFFYCIYLFLQFSRCLFHWWAKRHFGALEILIHHLQMPSKLETWKWSRQSFLIQKLILLRKNSEVTCMLQLSMAD